MKFLISAITLGCAGGVPFTCCGPDRPEEMNPASILAQQDSAQSNAVSFTELAPFLEWIDEALDQNEESKIVRSQTHKADAVGQLYDIERMKETLGQRSLSEVFSSEQFPSNESDFKLGGHSGALPHVHIDFKRNKDATWSLYRIWTCR